MYVSLYNKVDTLINVLTNMN